MYGVMKAVRGWIQQFIVLSWKNWLIISRRRIGTVLIAVLPSLFILGASLLFKYLSDPTALDPTARLSKCTNFDVTSLPYTPTEYPCLTIGFAPNTGNVSAVMQAVAANSGLVFGEDVVGFEDADEAGRFIYRNILRSVDFLVSFNESGTQPGYDADGDLGGDAWSRGQVEYAIWVNSSKLELYALNGMDNVWSSVGTPGRLLALQSAVDAAIVAHVSGIASAAAGISPPPSRPVDASNDVHDSAGGGGIFLSITAFSAYQSAAWLHLDAGTIFSLFAGPAFLAAPFSIVGSIVLIRVTVEKAQGLLAVLRASGLHQSTYLASWFVTLSPLMLLAAVGATAAGSLGSTMPLFTECDWRVHLVASMLLGLASLSFAMALAAIMRAQRWVTLSSFVYFTLSVALPLVMSSTGTFDRTYSPSSSPILPFVLFLLPFYHYGKVISDINAHVYGLDLIKGAFQPDSTATPSSSGGSGNGKPSTSSSMTVLQRFEWSDLFVNPPPHTVYVHGLQQQFTDVQPVYSLYMMLGVCGFYIVVAWYAGQVWTGDAGAALPWYFPFLPSYWGCNMRHFRTWRNAMEDMDTVSRLQEMSRLDGSMIVHKLRKLYGAANMRQFRTRINAMEDMDTVSRLQELSRLDGSMIVHKLSKSYGAATALTEVSLSVHKGQVLALLGHNGAGKTTLIHCVSGVIEPTHGEVLMLGTRLREDREAVRGVMGVCAQEDLVWEQLTARQNLTLVASFKSTGNNRDGASKLTGDSVSIGINGPPSKSKSGEGGINAVIDDLLSRLDLIHAADQPVSTFSGGMRRRLCVACACIGNPEILYLDEPTTGLDPVSRRRVWQLVQDLKKDRLVILTTHSMEEADALGDQIAILAQGRLRALGSPLYLKSRFGEGYTLTIVVDGGNRAALEVEIKALVPSAKVVDDATAADGQLERSEAAKAALTTAASPVSAVLAGPVAVRVVVPHRAVNLLPALVARLDQIASNGTIDAARQQQQEQEQDRYAQLQPPQQMVQGWSVSGSTLDDVFMRLAVASKAVNAALEGQNDDPEGAYGAQDPERDALLSPSLPHSLLAPSAIGSASGRGDGYRGDLQQQHRGCMLCGAAPPERVKLYTSKQVSVTLDDVICTACATRERHEIKSARMEMNAEVPRLADDADEPSDFAEGTLTGVPSQMSAPPPSAPSFPAKAEPSDFAKGALAGASLQMSAPPPSAPSFPASAAYHQMASPQLRPAASNDRSMPKAASAADDIDSDRDPVAFWSQFTAVFWLRMNLQLKQKKSLAGLVVLIVVAVVLAVYITPDQPNISDTPCSNSSAFPGVTWYFTNASFGGQSYNPNSGIFLDICDEDVFAQYMSLAVDRTPYQPYYAPNPRAGAATGSSSTGSRSLRPAAAVVGAQGASLSDPSYAYNQGPAAHRLYQPACIDHDQTRGYCLQNMPYSIYPDYQQASSVYAYNWMSVGGQLRLGTAVWFVDDSASTMSGTAGSSRLVHDLQADGYLPFNQYNLLGRGSGNNSVVNWVSYLDATKRNGPDATPLESLDAIDASIYNAQAVIRTKVAVMNGSCYNQGSWDGSGNWVGWQWGDANAASSWLWNTFPSAAVQITTSLPGAAVPTLSYSIKTWASSKADFMANTPGRPQSYTWTSVYSAGTPGQSYYCAYAGTQMPNDNPWSDVGSQMPTAALVSGIHNGFLRTALEMRGVQVNKTQPYIRTSFVQMPDVHWYANAAGAGSPGLSSGSGGSSGGGSSARSLGDSSSSSKGQLPDLQLLLWPLLTTATQPMTVAMLSTETSEKLFASIRLSGGRRGPYLAAVWIFGTVLAMIVSSIYVLCAYLAGVTSLQYSNPSSAGFGILLVLLSWASAQTCWSLLISCLSIGPRMATLISCMLVVAAAAASLLINSFVSPFPEGVAWVPILSYVRVTSLALTDPASVYRSGSPLQSATLITMLHAVLALLVGTVCHVIATDTAFFESASDSVTSSWRKFRNLLAGKASIERNADGGALLDDDALSSSAPALLFRGLVKRYRRSTDPLLVITRAIASGIQALYHLVVGYATVEDGEVKPKVSGEAPAVAGLDLIVPYGQVLGLLGPNGAGKTTTIACATGQERMSSGKILVAGHDVGSGTGLRKAWRAIGYCPQFDVIWSELSVREHFFFFARLKGIPERKLRAAVQSVAERVDLDGDPFDKPASQLSGGMKRRLSIGIALLGSPAVVFMDEPTTGLDPETKRQIHKIVRAAQHPRRAMVITTHSMEEADALCNRIGVMAAGKLRCIGTQVELKSQYGQGYTLQVRWSDIALQESIASGLGCFECVRALQTTLQQSAGCLATPLDETPPERGAHANAANSQGAAGSAIISAATPSASAKFLLSPALSNAAAASASSSSSMLNVAAVFAVLESCKQQRSLKFASSQPNPGQAGLSPSQLLADYCLSQSTLEDVFIRVTEMAAAEDAANTE